MNQSEGLTLPEGGLPKAAKHTYICIYIIFLTKYNSYFHEERGKKVIGEFLFLTI